MKRFSLKNFKFLLSLLAMTLVSLNSLAAGHKVYYTNPNGWDQPYAYVWGGSGGKAWPGEAMTWNDVKKMWEFEDSEDVAPTGILFHNNNGWQTLDLHFFANGIYGNSAFGAELFLRGTFNGWEATAQMKTANGVNYIIENYDFATTTSSWPNFKFADKAWKDVNFGINGDSKVTPGVEVTMTNWGDKDAYLTDTDAGKYTAKINTQTGKAILLSRNGGAGKPQVEFDGNRVATFSSIYNTDLTSLSKDVKVYYASDVADCVVTLTEVKDIKVAPNTGLYLFYTGELTGGKAAVEITESIGDSVALAGNKLVAWAPGETCCASLSDLAIHNYAFGKLNSSEVGFIHMKAEKKNETGIGKAYLQDAFNRVAATGANLKVRYKGEDPTKLVSVETVGSKTLDNTIYNLNGQAVGENYKGIVLRNGKSIIRK